MIGYLEKPGFIRFFYMLNASVFSIHIILKNSRGLATVLPTIPLSFLKK